MYTNAQIYTNIWGLPQPISFNYDQNALNTLSGLTLSMHAKNIMLCKECIENNSYVGRDNPQFGLG